MNNIYRVLWNEASGTYVAAPENARTGGASGASAVVQGAVEVAGAVSTKAGQVIWALLQPVAAALVSAGLVHAAGPAPDQLPAGGQVAAGSVSIRQNLGVMDIVQSSQRAAVNWQSFDVGSGARVNFSQPQASSVILNRVLGSTPSQIFGQINANGQVFLSNPNGVYFAPGSSVDVGALAATTHKISDADFMAGNYLLERQGATGSVVNQGTLSAQYGGYIALLAPEVRNQGVVLAKMGTVALAAGERYQLQIGSEGRLSNIVVTPATIAALVDNGNAVEAPGGLIILSAQAANRLQAGVVKNSGVLNATGLVSEGGTIRLVASDRIETTGRIAADAAPNSAGQGGRIALVTDLTNLAGRADIAGGLSARGGSLGGDGGFIETSAANLVIADGAQVNTSAPQGKFGTWLLDPTDFTISSGAGASTSSGIGATTLQDSLSRGNVSIATDASGAGNGDLTVDAPVSWSDNTTLSLSAYRHVNLNNGITASGTSGGLSVRSAVGGSGSVNLAANVVTGGAQVYNGSVVLNADAMLQSTAAGISITGGIASGTASAFTLNSATGSSVGGVISGTTALTKAGLGTLTLYGVNSYSGNTSVTAGTLTFAGNGFKYYGTLDIASGATFRVATSGQQELWGVISGNGDFVLNGGTVQISARNTYSGNITISSGRLKVAGGGTLGGGNYAGTISMAPGTGLTWQSTSSQVMSGVISGGGRVEVANGNSKTATLTLAGDNTYTGGTFVGGSSTVVATTASGILKAGSSTAFGTNTVKVWGGSVTVPGGVLDLNGQTISNALILNGTGIDLGGALINNNTVSATYAGLVTLGSNASVLGKNGKINLTNPGTLTGSGYGLTLGGAAGGSVTSILGMDTGGLTKQDAGTWTLLGANTYTGGSTVSAGTLQISGSLGSGSYAGNVALASGAVLQYSSDGAQTLAGIVSGAGSLLKDSNASTLTLSGTNTYTGGTRVNAGTLALGANDVLADTGAVTVNGTGTLSLGTYSDTVASVTLQGTGVISGSSGVLTSTGAYNLQAGSVSAILAGSAGANKTTTGTVTLSGANTYTGTTTVSAGTLALGASDVLASGGVVTVSGTGTLSLGAFSDTVASVSLQGTGAITGSTGVLTSTGAYNLQAGSVSAILAGSAGANKTTTGTVILSGANTYSGTTNVSAGTLSVRNEAALGNVSDGTTIASGATLDIQAALGAEPIALNGGTITNLSTTTYTVAAPITMGANSTFAASNSAGELIFGGSVNGNYSLTKAGLGKIGIAADFNNWGNTVITGGSLYLGADATLGSIERYIGVYSGNISISSGGSFSYASNGIQTFSGVISGAGSFQKSTSSFGTLTLSGANTYTGGTQISGGILKLASATALGAVTGSVSLTAGALDLNGQSIAYAKPLTLNGTGVNNGGALMNSSTTAASYAGLVTLGSASFIVGETGQITLSNVGTINGSSYGLTLGGAAGGSVASILGMGSGTLTKQDAGTWTLSGANTYTGGTTVSTGTLRVGNSQALGMGAVAVGSSASSAASLDLYGKTLANALTLYGYGSAGEGGSVGALTNSSATAATASGSVVLGSATSLGGSGAITVSGAITSNANGLVLLGAGADTLSNTANTLFTLASGAGVGSVAVNNAGALTIGSVSLGASSYSGIASSGAVSVGTTVGNLTVTRPVSAGSSLVLAAGGATAAGTSTGGDVVLSGAPSLTGTSAKIYTGSLAGSSGVTSAVGSGSGNFRYNSTQGVNNFSAALGSGLYAIYREQPTYSITANSAADITYGASAPAYTFTGGGQNGDTVVQALGLAASVTDDGLKSGAGKLTAGAHTLSVTGTVNQLGYALAYSTGTITVNRANLVVSGLTAANKSYDADPGATLGAMAVVSALAGDVVTVGGTASGTFADKNVGPDKLITVAGNTIAGADAANYNLVQQTGLKASITQASLVVRANNDARFVTLSDAVGYDGVVYNGFVGGESSSTADLGGSLSIDRTNRQTDLASGTYSGVLVASGLTSANYAISYRPGDYTIVPADQLLVKVANNSSVYGSTPVYSITSAQYLNGDQVLSNLALTSSSGATYEYSDGNHGGTVFTLAPSGAAYSSSGNLRVGSYQLGASSSTILGNNFRSLNIVGSQTVTAKPLTVSYLGAAKTYDATRTASVSATDDRIAGDLFNLTSTAAFADKNAGPVKTINISGVSLSGADAQNYTVSATASTSATITKASLVVSGLVAVGKTYDGTLSAALAGTATVAPLAQDTVVVGDVAVGSFADKNVGAAKAVTVTGTTISGADAENYALVQQGGLTAAISQAPLNLAISKIYNGTNTFSNANSYSLSGMVGSDAAPTIGVGAATVTSTNVASYSSFSSNTLTLSDSNYTLTGGTVAATIGQLASVTYTGASGGNWSSASNWAGGAIPTLDNVASVQIPVATTVVYDQSNLGGLTPTSAIAIASSASLSVVNASALTLAGAMSGAGALRKSGAGMLTLSGANTYLGATAVEAGALRVTGSLADTAAVSVASGSSYHAAVSHTVGSLSGAGGVVLEAGVTLSAGGNNSSTSLSGAVSGAGALAKEGVGTFTLSGTNSFGGGVAVNAGTLALGSANALGGGVATVAIGAALDLQGNSVTNALTLSGTGVSLSGALYNSSASAATVSGAITLAADTLIKNTGALTLSTIDGAYALSFQPTGTLTLAGNIGSNSAPASLSTVPGTGTTVLGTVNVNTTGAQAYGNLDISTSLVAPTTLRTLGGDVQVLGAINSGIAGGNLAVDIGAGNLTLGSARTDVATGNLNLSAAVNRLSKLSIASAADVEMTNTTPLELGTSFVSGSLTLGNKNANITQSGFVRVAGDTLFESDAAAIRLDMEGASGNMFGGTLGRLTLINSGNNDIRIYTPDALRLDHIDTGPGVLNLRASEIRQDNALASVKLRGSLVTNNTAMVFDAPITLDAALLIDAGTGTLKLNGAVATGTNQLSVKADAIDLSGATLSGSSFALTTSTAGKAIVLGSTNDSSAMAISTSDFTKLMGMDSLSIGDSSSTNPITVSSALTVTKPMTVTLAAGGSFTVNNQITVSNGTFAVAGSGHTTHLNADIVTDSQAVYIQDSVVLGANVKIDTTNGGTSAGAAVTIAEVSAGVGGTVNSDSSSTRRNLTVTAGTGAARFAGALGDSVALGALDITAAGGISLPSAVTTYGTQTYRSAVSLHQATTLTSNDYAVAFSSTVNSASATAQSLMVAAGAGDIDFSDAVGGIHALSGLSLTGATVSAQAIALTGSLAVNNAAESVIAGTVSGSGSVVKAGTGTLALTGFNTYTGGTTVSAGTLRAGNSRALGVGAVAVGSSASSAASLDLYGNEVGNALTLYGYGSAGEGGTVGALTNSSATAANVSGAVGLGSASAIGGSGAITLSGSVAASGNGLVFVGTGANTLSNSANTLGTIATDAAAGALSVANSGALTVGIVTLGSTHYSGIASTGAVAVNTLAGDLTVNSQVSTTGSSLVLGAGRATVAGTSTGGNVLLIGRSALSVGAGGRATIFTGSIAGSTGVTSVVGSGSGNFRYNSTQGVNNFSAALGSGLYAIYREQPTLTIAVDAVSSIDYGTVSPNYTTTVSGQNGDTASQALRTNATVSVGGATSSAGFLTAGAHLLNAAGAVDQLGYALAYSANTLTVNRATLTVSGLTAANKTYDGSTSAPLGGTATVTALGGDKVTVGGVAVGAFTDKLVGTGKLVTVSGNTLDGADAANYSVVQQTGLRADITPSIPQDVFLTSNIMNAAVCSTAPLADFSISGALTPTQADAPKDAASKPASASKTSLASGCS